MLNFSSDINIVQEPSISKFVTHHMMLLSLVPSLKIRFFGKKSERKGMVDGTSEE